MNQDNRLQEKITRHLQEKMNLSAEDINVRVVKGKIQLSGCVDVLAEKERAEELVREVAGAEPLDNSLTVVTENVPADKDVEAAVRERLQRHGIDLGHIGVKVSNGVVVLVGKTASWAEEEAARQAASQVYGVKEVISQVEAGTLADWDDATITNSIEDVFAHAETLANHDIVTQTRAGVVTLLGWVDRPEDRTTAEKLAGQVPGVKKVRNHLRVREGARNGDIALTNQARSLLGASGLAMVRVYVVEGIAFLAGRVASIDQKKKAEALVTGIEGIKGINNSIIVSLH